MVSTHSLRAKHQGRTTAASARIQDLNNKLEGIVVYPFFAYALQQNTQASGELYKRQAAKLGAFPHRGSCPVSRWLTFYRSALGILHASQGMGFLIFCDLSFYGNGD